MGARRQARLRREYASWYPMIEVATWMPAKSAANAVRRQLADGEPKWALGPRVLDDRHFEFRGGVDRDATERTRTGDEAAARQRRARAGAPPPHTQPAPDLPC